MDMEITLEISNKNVCLRSIVMKGSQYKTTTIVGTRPSILFEDLT